MTTFIILDQTGDTRVKFDTTDDTAVKEAMERFNDLVGNKGYRAAKLGTDGATGELVDKFNKEDENVLFIPQIIGG